MFADVLNVALSNSKVVQVSPSFSTSFSTVFLLFEARWRCPKLSMDRMCPKVLKCTLCFSHGSESSLKVDEVRQDSISFAKLKSVKVRQRSPRFDQTRQGSLGFAGILRASVMPMAVSLRFSEVR